MRHFHRKFSHVKLLALHAIEGPIDGALEPEGAAETVADIDREVLELLEAFDVGHSGADHATRCLAVVIGKTRLSARCARRGEAETDGQERLPKHDGPPRNRTDK